MSECKLERVDNLADEAALLRERGQYAAAEELQREIIEDNRHLRDPEDRAMLVARGQLAHTLWCLGRYNEAAEEQENLFVIFKRKFGWGDHGTLGIVGHLVEAYISLGRYDAARDLAVRLQVQQDEFYGRDSIPSRDTQQQLATISHIQGRFPEAAKIRMHILKLELVSSDAPGRQAAALHDYGKTLMAQGEFKDSLHNLNQALEMSREQNGPDHPTTIQYQSTLALLYWEQGNFDEATTAYREVLGHRSKSLGEAHAKTICSISDLAGSLFLQGLNNESKAQLDRAVTLAKEYLEARNPDRLAILCNAASIYRALGRPDLELAHESFDLSRRVKGDDNPETLNAMMEYAGALVCNKQLGVALEIMKLCVLRTTRKHGQDHHLTTARATELAKVQEMQRQQR